MTASISSPGPGIRSGDDDELPGLPVLSRIGRDEEGLDEPLAALSNGDDDGEGLDDSVGGLDGLETVALDGADDEDEEGDDGTEGFDEPLSEEETAFGAETEGYGDDSLDESEEGLDDLDLGERGEEDSGEVGFDDEEDAEGDDESAVLPPLDRSLDESDGPIGEPPPSLTDRGDD